MKSTSSPLKQPLYQVVVERTSDGEPIRVGPAMLKEATDQFAETIRAQIALGREKEWSNPHVVPFLNHTTH